MKLVLFARFAYGAVLLGLAFFLSWQNTAHADSITVDTLLDENDHSCVDGDCSLRDALEIANNGDTITFSVTGTITLTLGWLTLDKDLTINGPGVSSLTLSGNDSTRVFAISPRVTAAISGITVAHSMFSGISNQGNLRVTASAFVSNFTTGFGGAILNGGVATVSDSTFAQNSAFEYGGGAIANYGILDISNSTFFDNRTVFKYGYGGAIYNSGGALTVTNSTFSENGATTAGGHIWGSATLKNTILSNATRGGNCAGNQTDGGGNLLWPRTDASCVGAHGDPKLGLLADNGGPTQTMALGANSAALEQGDPANCLAADQRGQPRPNPPGSKCDIGAYESDLRPTEIRWEDDDPRVQYDSWRGQENDKARASYRVSKVKNDTVTFTFHGKQIIWITRTGPDMGIAQVTIDGVDKGLINLYSPTEHWRVEKDFAIQTPGPHKLLIRVTGNKNAAASNTNVVVDAFKTRITTEDTALNVRYDGWKGKPNDSASGSSYRQSSKTGAFVRLKFSGAQIEWITAKGPMYGMAAVYLDGVKQAVYDLYSPAPIQWQAPIAFSGLTAGEHTLEIRVLGKKNAASSGMMVIVDAFRSPISPP